MYPRFFIKYYKNFFLLIIAFTLYVCAVLFGVNSFTGFFNKLYLIHFGNSIIIATMLEMDDNLLKWFTPFIGFAAYDTIRSETQTQIYIAALGTFNIFEQYIGYFAIKSIKNPVTSFGFVSKLFIYTFILSITFAIPGSYTASYINHTLWWTSFLVYSMSHIIGTYIGLYNYKIFRHIKINLSLIFIRDYFIVIALICFFNSFKNYPHLGMLALISSYPLLAIFASRHNQIATGITDLSIVFIIFALSSIKRGSFWYVNRGDNRLSLVIGLGAFIITSSLLSAYISIGMQNLRDLLNETLIIKNDIAFIFSQVSHDIRSPIMQIQDILQRVSINSYTKNDLEDAIEECDILNNLMESWLMAVHASPCKETRSLFVLHEKPINLNNIIAFLNKRTLKYIDSNDKVKFILEYTHYNNLVILDPLYLIQIIFNLLTNAIKSTDNGHVKLNVYINEDKTLIVKISDTGCGIDQNRINNLFTNFTTTNTKVSKSNNFIPSSSHGVGLQIVKKFTDLMNGKISTKSIINEGTTFTLELPVTISDNTNDIETTVLNTSCSTYVEAFTQNEFSIVNLKICIAEDEKICTALINRMLNECDTKFFVKDGNQIITVLIDNGPFDILCLDGSLPNKNAEDIIAELISMRSTHFNKLSKLKILITSGRELTIDINSIPFPTVYCCKPFSKNVLLTKIEKIIDNNKNTIII